MKYFPGKIYFRRCAAVFLVLQIRQESFTSTVISHSVQFSRRCRIPNLLSDRLASSLYNKLSTQLELVLEKFMLLYVSLFS